MEVLVFSAQIIHHPLANPAVTHDLALSSDERRKSIISLVTESKEIRLQLFDHEARGTILKHGNLLLIEETSEIVQISAKPEPVMTAITTDISLLLRAAYHLGNRHVPIEITTEWLRFQPDPVLKNMLEQMGLLVLEEIVPFQPEAGAYHSH